MRHRTTHRQRGITHAAVRVSARSHEAHNTQRSRPPPSPRPPVDLCNADDHDPCCAQITSAPGAPTLPRSEAGYDIEFRDVHFAYRPDAPILRGVTLSVPAGSTCAIVGTSGSGKSTLFRLLHRFYDPAAGSVRIAGRDVREWDLTSLRQPIAAVPQDVVLFNDTVAYNIGYGRPGASQEDVEDAARAAKLHDAIIAMPDGYSTEVGERGLKLSGGEKQRLALARAFLKVRALHRQRGRTWPRPCFARV